MKALPRVYSSAAAHRPRPRKAADSVQPSLRRRPRLAIRPASQSRATWPKIVRPTAKPLTNGNSAAMLEALGEFLLGRVEAQHDDSAGVRVVFRRSLAQAASQARLVFSGSSFHQSGKDPHARKCGG